jgi:predicted anti-sigma-YlaC factor YlaD
MNHHLDQYSLIGYICRTLDDAKRESIDEHLQYCPTCRGLVAEGERRQRQISNELSAAVNRAAIPNQMSFASIAPRLQPQSVLRFPWPSLAVPPSLAFTLIGLVLALAGLWQVIRLHDPTDPTPYIGALPPLACFFFMLASVEGYDKAAFSIQPRYAVIALATAILWLGTAVIGLLDILAILDLAIVAVVAIGGSVAEVAPFAMLATYFLGGTLYIFAVIGGGEYHRKNYGQPRSWKLFSITLIVQLFILLLPYWVY